mmetsp:Transcript_38992/g.76642  ORF Transcript_38992/g.76642 Transcript_38992/m.76642 type:complete len:97 (+) Transcript_38992:1070-1360(+)
MRCLLDSLRTPRRRRERIDREERTHTTEKKETSESEVKRLHDDSRRRRKEGRKDLLLVERTSHFLSSRSVGKAKGVALDRKRRKGENQKERFSLPL